MKRKNKFKFTDIFIDKIKLKNNKRQMSYSDSISTGLGLMVYKNSKKYVTRVMYNNHRYVKTIGDAISMTVHQARTVNEKIRNDIIIQGKDYKKSKDVLFNHLFDRYLNDYAKYNLKPKTINSLNGYFKKSFKPILNKPVLDISIQDIKKIFNSYSKKTYL
ncbi:MAG TPA: hypothetical protein QKA14_01760 [Candidatus Megaira endosymbiont of Hartmannula sinica]|nr:hypothetical protein [Candidatus Megaera endosymbiont of Hartmannula sinica]